MSAEGLKGGRGSCEFEGALEVEPGPEWARGRV